MCYSNTKKDKLAVKGSLTGFHIHILLLNLCIIIISHYLEGFEEGPSDFDEHQLYVLVGCKGYESTSTCSALRLR